MIYVYQYFNEIRLSKPYKVSKYSINEIFEILSKLIMRECCVFVNIEIKCVLLCFKKVIIYMAYVHVKFLLVLVFDTLRLIRVK